MDNLKNEFIFERIKAIKKEENVYSIGRVNKIQDYVLEISGLDEAAYFDEVKIGEGSIGYVANITLNSISIVVVKQIGEIHVGDEVVSTGKEFTASYSEDSLGKIVDMFGKDKLKDMEFSNLIDS